MPTTTTQTTTAIRPEIRFEPDYVWTLNGKIMIALLILGLINVIIINVAPVWYPATGFFNTVLGLAWWYTLIKFFLFIFHVPEKFYTIPWLPIEIGIISVLTLLYFIASLLVILRPDTTHTIAGVFGFITTGAYGYLGYLKFTAWKNGELAQGSLSRSTTTTSNVQASAYPA